MPTYVTERHPDKSPSSVLSREIDWEAGRTSLYDNCRHKPPHSIEDAIDQVMKGSVRTFTKSRRTKLDEALEKLLVIFWQAERRYGCKKSICDFREAWQNQKKIHSEMYRFEDQRWKSFCDSPGTHKLLSALWRSSLTFTTSSLFCIDATLSLLTA